MNNKVKFIIVIAVSLTFIFITHFSFLQEKLSMVIKSPTIPFTTYHCTTSRGTNVVYLLADDLGYGDVEYNGGQAKTPNINQMANGNHSILFTRFYSGGPVCSPTRGTLLTGRNHNRYCIWHADLGVPTNDHECPALVPLPTSEITLPKLLQNEGYDTVIYGKWHIGDLKKIAGGNTKWPVSHPGMHGFTHWLVTERHSMSVLPNCRCNKKYSCSLDGRVYKPFCCRNYWSMNPYTQQLELFPHQVFEDSHFLVDQFEYFIRNRNRSKPFFVVLSFHTVHTEYLATPYWYDFYKNKSRNERNYLGAISSLDEAVGRVRDILHRHNLSCNTMVWFSSDNGPESQGPGSSGGLRGGKGTITEGGIRVPGIIEWPAVIQRNLKLNIPVVTTDLFPTVANILRIPLPTDRFIDGKSILPILQAKTKVRGENIKFAFHIRKGNLYSKFSAAAVGDRYKILVDYYLGKVQRFRLYDLWNDVAENRDVSQSHPKLTSSMLKEIDQFLISVTESAKAVGCIDTNDRRNSKKCYVRYY